MKFKCNRVLKVSYPNLQNTLYLICNFKLYLEPRKIILKFHS